MGVVRATCAKGPGAAHRERSPSPPPTPPGHPRSPGLGPRWRAGSASPRSGWHVRPDAQIVNARTHQLNYSVLDSMAVYHPKGYVGPIVSAGALMRQSIAKPDIQKVVNAK